MRQRGQTLINTYYGSRSWQALRFMALGGALWCGVASGATTPKDKPAPPPHFTTHALATHYVSKGWRLEGDAVVTLAQFERGEGGAVFTSSQSEVRAPRMDVDLANPGSPAHIRAQGGVDFKIDLRNKENTAPSHFEGHSDTADLNVAQKTLVLKGKLDGWYQVAGGQPDKLRGGQATLTFARPNLKIEVEGGPAGVRFEFAPDMPKPAPGKNNPNANQQNANPAENNTPPANSQNNGAKGTAQLGPVVVTAQRATINAVLNSAGSAPVPAGQNSGATGTARFIGNAHAVSADGPQHFDIAAPEFVLTRGTAGALDNLKTAGRTHLKIDFPPSPPASNGAAQGALDAVTGGASASAATTPKPSAFGTPTHVEAEADVATLQPALSQATLQGNITGFYRLTSETGEAQEFNFSGADSVVLKNVAPGEANDDNPAGLHVDALGKPGQPVTIETPGLDINMDKGKSATPKRKR